jgi:hypothetical protein
VNFTDQSINRGLALKGSSDFKLVTLDMKEASDRVSLELVKSLFPANWYDALYASRTSGTLLPNGEKVLLKKFAPMGSAVCFPVEALIFWALSTSVVMNTQNLPLSIAATKVWVYGDDIICDAHYQGVINLHLPKFGVMLNESKCCTAGPFKESCGMDAFYGQPVTPVKFHSVWCTTPEPGMIASYVELSNEFYRRGMFATAFHLERELQWVIRTRRKHAIPTVSSGEPSCIAFVRPYEKALAKNRRLGIPFFYDEERQVFMVAGYCLESELVMAKTDSWSFLTRVLTDLERKTAKCKGDVSPMHATASELPTGQYPIAHRVRLMRAWTPVR